MAVGTACGSSLAVPEDRAAGEVAVLVHTTPGSDGRALYGLELEVYEPFSGDAADALRTRRMLRNRRSAPCPRSTSRTLAW
jgi:hypothetical protein